MRVHEQILPHAVLLKMQRFQIGEELRSRDAVDKVLEYDQLCFLPSYLQRQDQVGMMFSLEVRPPLLDDEFVRLANRISGPLKINQGPDCKNQVTDRKYVFRKFASQHVPTNVVWHDKKYQYSYPGTESLGNGGEFRRVFDDLLTGQNNLSTYFDINGIKSLLNEHDPHTQNDHSNTLFRLLSMGLWLRTGKEKWSAKVAVG